MDLLSVLMHEVGHLLDYDHGEPGASATGVVMQKTLSAGQRITLHSIALHESWWLIDLPELMRQREPFRWWL